MKLSRNAKKMVALTLSAALVIGGITVNGSSASAAKKATLKLNKKSAKVTVGKKVTLKVKKTNVKSAKITWKSSNKAVASVNKKGVVTGKKAGKAKISATVKYKIKGSKKTKKKTLKCTVTVTGKSVTVTKAPGGNTTPTPGAVASPTPGTVVTPPVVTPAPTGDTTQPPAPTGDTTQPPAPTGEASASPTSAVEPTATPVVEPTATPEPEVPAEPVEPGKWYSGSYSATLTKSGTSEAEITESTLDEDAALRIKEAVSFGVMKNPKEQPALLIDCSKMITKGLTTPAINITVSTKSNIMHAESLDVEGWDWLGNLESYTSTFDAKKDVYAVYVGDKTGEITISVSLLDAADLPKVTTEDIPSHITLKSGDTINVGLEFAANEYTYESDAIKVYNSQTEAVYSGVTCEYSETDKQLSITATSGVNLDATKTRVDYTRTYVNADGMKYGLTVSFSHVAEGVKVLTMESTWAPGWDAALLVSPATLKAAGLTEDNLAGSKIILTNGDTGGCSGISFKSGGQCSGDDWLNPNQIKEVTLKATDTAILTNGLWVGLQFAPPASVLLVLAD